MSVKLTVTIKSGNSAFSESPESALADMLEELARDIRKGRSGKLSMVDLNGNRCGEAFLQIKAEA